jgi:thiamine-monophosphate kinase
MLSGVSSKASDLGEFRLIDRLLAHLGDGGEGVVIGPGDDAAAVRIGEATALTTADMLLEGVHFEIGLSSPADVGWKALAVNVSDVAAMGGVPRFALVSLGAPSATPAATLERIYEGLDECARTYGVAVVGGDTVGGDRLIVSVAVLGEPGPSGILTRGGARMGDLVCVTGEVGGAAAGLALLRAASNDERAANVLDRFPALAGAHRRPTPRVREGTAAAQAGATAMIDVSDGLGRDIGHICESSGVGVRVFGVQIPLADGISDVARWAGVDPIRLAVGGGDDYELALTIPADRFDALVNAAAPTKVTRIGEIVAGREAVLDRGDGTVEPLSALGWDHFEEQT